MARPKKRALVSQYLERVSHEALELYRDVLKEYTRHRDGVYALYRADRLYYVGLARDLRKRVNQHLKDHHKGAWDRFSMYLTIGDDHIRELESLVLRIVRPKGNKQVGKFARAVDLQRTLRQKAKQKSQQKIDEIFSRKVLDKRANAVRALPDEGKRPVLAGFGIRPTRLRGTFKGKKCLARVLKNGTITVKGQRFNSPSMAARHAIGQMRAINGWWFWHYERAPNDWVRLRELRR